MDWAGKRSESRIRRIALISRILTTLIIANNLIRAIFIIRIIRDSEF